MSHEHFYTYPHVVEIPEIRESLTPDTFGVFPRPIAGGSPDLDEPDYSIGIAEFAKALIKNSV